MTGDSPAMLSPAGAVAGSPSSHGIMGGQLMYQKLPREIRDLVYEQFWIEEERMREWLRIWYSSLLLGRTLHVPFDQLCSAICSVYPQISAELVEWYYENHGEDLGVGQFNDMPSWYLSSHLRGHKCDLEGLDIQDVARFMTTDVFGAGVTPADCKLRALTVRIDLATFTSRWDIDELLQPIKTQRRSDGFTLFVNVVGWWTDDFSFDLISHLGSQLKETLRELVAEQISVSVRLSLFHCRRSPSENPRVVSDVRNSLGLSEDGWEDFLFERLGDP